MNRVMYLFSLFNLKEHIFFLNHLEPMINALTWPHLEVKEQFSQKITILVKDHPEISLTWFQ